MLSTMAEFYIILGQVLSGMLHDHIEQAPSDNFLRQIGFEALRHEGSAKGYFIGYFCSHRTRVVEWE